MGASTGRGFKRRHEIGPHRLFDRAAGLFSLRRSQITSSNSDYIKSVLDVVFDNNVFEPGVYLPEWSHEARVRANRKRQNGGLGNRTILLLVATAHHLQEQVGRHWVFEFRQRAIVETSQVQVARVLREMGEDFDRLATSNERQGLCRKLRRPVILQRLFELLDDRWTSGERCIQQPV